MNTQNCPLCDEQNPVEAVMCWNCFTPLGVDDPNQNALKNKNHVSKNIARFMLMGGGVLICLGLRQRSRQGFIAFILGSGLAFSGARRLKNQGGALIEEAARRFDANEDIAANQTEDVPPIVRIANTILTYAVKDGASEIHIEPQQKGVLVLFLVDGIFHEQMKVPSFVLKPLAERFKAMCAMNWRARQTGKLEFTMSDRKYAADVSFTPTQFGDEILLRFE